MIASAMAKKVGASKVQILSGSLKGSESYAYLTEFEEIHPDVEFLFTTRVISDGANIKNEIACVYLIDLNNNFWVKRQFLGRFRTKLNQVVELIDFDATKDIDFNELDNLFLLGQ